MPILLIVFQSPPRAVGIQEEITVWFLYCLDCLFLSLSTGWRLKLFIGIFLRVFLVLLSMHVGPSGCRYSVLKDRLPGNDIVSYEPRKYS